MKFFWIWHKSDADPSKAKGWKEAQKQGITRPNPLENQQKRILCSNMLPHQFNQAAVDRRWTWPILNRKGRTCKNRQCKAQTQSRIMSYPHVPVVSLCSICCPSQSHHMSRRPIKGRCHIWIWSLVAENAHLFGKRFGPPLKWVPVSYDDWHTRLWERGACMHTAPQTPQNEMVLHPNEIKERDGDILAISKFKVWFHRVFTRHALTRIWRTWFCMCRMHSIL